MGKKKDFDYIIIGSGPAGVAAALMLARNPKRKVAVVEGGKWGGSNVNTHDLPYDVSLNFSHTLHSAMRGGFFGLSNIGNHFNYPTAVSYREKVIGKISNDIKTSLKAAGVTCISGSANFIDNTHIAVDDYQYSAKRFIIATGAKTNVSGISGTSTMKYYTPENALDIKRLPKAICIIGGGTSGCETAQYFAELGVKTVLLELTDRLLPREDKEVGDIINKYFTEELGITVMTNSRAVAICHDEISDSVIFSNNRQEKMVRVEAIVIATGAEPNVDLGLENAGVKYNYNGIVVNNRFQTTAKNIFAVGDVIGGDSSTDIAAYQGKYLATNLIRKVKNLPDYSGFARITRTYPEVATVGLSEDDLTKRDKKYISSIVFLPVTNVSATRNFSDGFVKILTDKFGEILGATVVAPNAEILIQEIGFALRYGMNVTAIASAPHVVNSFSEVVRIAAEKMIGGLN